MKNIEAKELSPEEVKEEKSKYTRKITLPVYEPKNKCPNINELYDTTKRDELIADIEKEKLNPELKEFLLSAAERHTAFDFAKIADFYSHMPIKYKKLFENSSLVIIDYDNAIRNGFVVYQKEVDESRLEYLESLSDEYLSKNKEDANSREDARRLKNIKEEIEYIKSLDDDNEW